MSVIVEVVVDKSTVEFALAKIVANTSPIELASWLANEVDAFFMGRSRSRFTSEGDDASGGWAPLALATINIRESMGFGGQHPINVRTGELRQFMLDGGNTSPTGEGAVYIYPGTNPTGRVGQKFTTAQQGKAWGGRYTPPRPVLAIDETDVEFVLVSLLRNMLGGLG